MFFYAGILCLGIGRRWKSWGNDKMKLMSWGTKNSMMVLEDLPFFFAKNWVRNTVAGISFSPPELHTQQTSFPQCRWTCPQQRHETDTWNCLFFVVQKKHAKLFLSITNCGKTKQATIPRTATRQLTKSNLLPNLHLPTRAAQHCAKRCWLQLQQLDLQKHHLSLTRKPFSHPTWFEAVHASVNVDRIARKHSKHRHVQQIQHTELNLGKTRRRRRMRQQKQNTRKKARHAFLDYRNAKVLSQRQRNNHVRWTFKPKGESKNSCFDCSNPSTPQSEEQLPRTKEQSCASISSQEHHPKIPVFFISLSLDHYKSRIPSKWWAKSRLSLRWTFGLAGKTDEIRWSSSPAKQSSVHKTFFTRVAILAFYRHQSWNNSESFRNFGIAGFGQVFPKHAVFEQRWNHAVNEEVRHKIAKHTRHSHTSQRQRRARVCQNAKGGAKSRNHRQKWLGNATTNKSAHSKACKTDHENGKHKKKQRTKKKKKWNHQAKRLKTQNSERPSTFALKKTQENGQTSDYVDALMTTRQSWPIYVTVGPWQGLTPVHCFIVWLYPSLCSHQFQRVPIIKTTQHRCDQSRSNSHACDILLHLNQGSFQVSDWWLPSPIVLLVCFHVGRWRWAARCGRFHSCICKCSQQLWICSEGETCSRFLEGREGK